MVMISLHTISQAYLQWFVIVIKPTANRPYLDSNSDPSVVQLLAIRYTDYAVVDKINVNLCGEDFKL
jgi:hypothetical protein